MRLFRGLLVATLALCAVVAILIVALNFYLGLPQIAVRAQDLVSQALGLPATFTGFRINAAKGASAADFKLANPASAAAPVLLASPAVSATYAPQAFLEHRLLIRQIVVEKPAVSLEVTPAGTLALPASVPVQSGGLASSFRKARVIVKSYTAAGGTVRLLGYWGGSLLELRDVGVGGRLEQVDGTVKTSGQFTSAVLALGPFQAANVQGSYDLSGGVLNLTKLIGTACHGQLAGSFQLNTRTADMPCDLQLQAGAFDLNELFKSAFSRPDLLSGALDFTVTARKVGAAWTAQGSFALRDGQLIRIDFAAELAAALGLKDLAQPDFSAASGQFSLDQGIVTLTGLDLKGANFELTGTGTMRPVDTTAALDLQLVLQPDLAKQLAPAVAAQLSSGDNGTKTLHFSVAGHLDHLKTVPTVHF